MVRFKHYFLLLLLSLCSMVSYAYDFEVDGLYYNLVSATEKTCELVGCADNITSINIPANVTTRGLTLHVVSVKEASFANNKNIVSFSSAIPLDIPQQAFANCTSLVSVTIFPGTKNIANKAFYNCPIENLSIPNSVVSIGTDAINRVSYLKLEDGEGMLSIASTPYLRELYLGRNVQSSFVQSSDLRNVEFGKNVTNLRDMMFVNCKYLESVRIPSSVRSIGMSCFKGCTNLHSLTFEDSNSALSLYQTASGPEIYEAVHKSISYYYEGPFEGCRLRNIVIGRNISYNGQAASKTTEYEDYNYSTGTYIFTRYYYKGLFDTNEVENIIIGENVTSLIPSLCSNLAIQEITIPESIRTISNHCFENCKVLCKVNFPKNVDFEIGDYAFSGCSNLKAFKSSNCTLIGTEAFSNCKNLRVVETEASEIGNSCFANTGLEWCSLGSNIKTIGSNVFSGCDNIRTIGVNVTSPAVATSATFAGVNKFSTDLYIPQGTTAAYEQAEGWKEFLFKIEEEMPQYIHEAKVDISNSININTIIKGDLTGAIINQINASTSIETLDLQAASIVLDNQNAYYETGKKMVGDLDNLNLDQLRDAPYYSDVYYTAPTTVSGPNNEYNSSGKLINAITVHFCSDLTNANLNASLKCIKLPSSLTKLGANAIKGNSLTDLYVHSTTPPAATAKSFGSTNKTTCVLHVPEGCKDAYASAIGWKDFKNIVEAASDNYIEVQPTNDNRQVILARDDDNAKYQWYKYVEKTGTEIDVTSLLASDAGWEITAEGWCSNMHNAESAAVLSYEHTFNAGDVLSFDWSVSSEEIFDQLQCYLGDELLFAKSGEESGSFSKTFDSSVSGKLSFVYIKDHIVDVAKDNAVISNVKISSSENVTVQLPEVIANETSKDLSVGSATYGDRVFCIVTLGDGKQIKSNELVLEYVNFIKTQPTVNNLCVELDTPDDGAKYQWYQYLETKTDSKTVTPNSSGTYVWEENAGVWTSNNIGINSSSAVMSATIDVQAGDKLSFDWNVSSESGYDFLIVTIDGSQVLKKSGTDKGTYEKAFTSSATVSVEFKYTKDSSQQSGSDCATVSEIRLTNPNGFIEKVDSEIENATASVLERSLITNECEVYCVVTLQNGRILTSDRVLVKAVIPGDANADGHVTQEDLSTLVAYVLGGDSPDIEIYNADINGDGAISIADITALIEKLQSSDESTTEGNGDDHGDNGGIQEDTEDNDEYVDLGLPSGTLWATRNVGADNPEDYGDYFAWGEVEPKNTYGWSTYKYCNGSSTTLTKYCTDSYYGTVDYKTELDLEDDAAYMNWGEGWRMPSIAQIEELYDSNYTTAQWVTRNGNGGRLITSKSNGNSIFLPAAGSRHNDMLLSAGSYGYYWLRSLYSDMSYGGTCYLNFYSTYMVWSRSTREDGLPVRPVRKK